LREWCQQKQFYLYTSNVDGHFRIAGFPEALIHEIHGNIETWFAVSSVSNSERKGNGPITVPGSYSFQVDETTLEGADPELIWKDLASDTDANFDGSFYLRPKVLMFDDGFESHRQMGLNSSCDRYQAWESQMEDKMEVSNTLELVVLEIGCGTRVPSVRIECQEVIKDTASRCTDSSPRCSFIRINPDEEASQSVPDNFTSIHIRGSALEVLERINCCYELHQHCPSSVLNR
jgi:NAD-dependent SIR2 family protein deacetylase